jgi:thiosulfate/3-mercaptopyruvate sulfurtransferase
VHSIQRRTKQNSSCNACHGQKELFLTEADLAKDEPTANQKIIVKKIPGEIKK